MWPPSRLSRSESQKSGIYGYTTNKIAEFLTKTEQKKCKNKQTLLLNGYYLLFEDYL